MQFEHLIMHAETRRQLAAYIHSSPHALLIVGAEGMGKLTVARVWARALLDGSDEGLRVISPEEKGGISIEAIRELYRVTRSKNQLQVVIIDHAEALSTEAQNAFLKLLEEPRPGLTFVLTAPHTSTLLPTVLSRTQQAIVRPVSEPDLRPLLETKVISPADKAQLLFIANGRPAMLATLLQDPAAFDEAKNTMQCAKELLAAKPYDRLVAVAVLAADRGRCIVTLEAMQRMASLQLKRAQNARQSRQWLQMTDALEDILAHLSRNANAKLQLLKLFTGSNDLL